MKFANRLSLIMFSGLLFLAACENKQSSTGGDFYELLKAGDLRRLPLLKPYVVENKSEGDWHINLLNNEIRYFNYPIIDSINVIDGTIIARCARNCTLPERPANDIWLIIIPNRSVEKIIVSESEFEEQLIKLGVKSYRFLSVDAAYQEVYDTGDLPWKIRTRFERKDIKPVTDSKF